MALMAAIGMLMIFALLGTAYVSYMSIEFQDAGTQLHRIRARNLATGGVYAAIGEIQSRQAGGAGPESSYAIVLATYRHEQGGPGAYPQTVHVAVSDESARLNLNTAPPATLEKMGLSADAASKLVAMRAEGRKLASVDALRTNDIVDAADYEALNEDQFTVYTGGVAGVSGGTVNLNSAGPEVLSAVFGISADEASALAQKRPFKDWADVLQKVGREPATFNVDVAPFALREQPADVSFASNTFRLRSTVTMNMPGGDHRPVYAGVEAVVAFGADGAYAIRYWRELRGADAREAEESSGAAVEPAKTSEEPN